MLNIIKKSVRAKGIKYCNVPTNQPGMRMMVQPCGTTDLAKQNRSIDLSTGFLIALLNIVEIVMIARIKRKKRIYELILLSLSVSDCMFGLSNVIVSSIVLSQHCGNNLFGRAYAFHVFFVLTSIFHLIFIAVDRLMIVLIPFQYETIFTTKRLRIGVAVLWILSLAIGVTSYLTYEFTTPGLTFRALNISSSRNNSFVTRPVTRLIPTKQRFQPVAQLVLSIVIVTLDFLMIFCYSTIIYQMSFKNRKTVATPAEDDHQLPFLCVFIAGVFVMFTLPYVATRFYLGYVPFWANYILILNSGMNSIVYFFRQRIEKYHSKKTSGDRQNSLTKGSFDN